MARSMDADLWLLLTEEEEAQYLARSLRAAAQRCADLVPCPAPGCEGLAVTGPGADPKRQCKFARFVVCSAALADDLPRAWLRRPGFGWPWCGPFR